MNLTYAEAGAGEPAAVLLHGWVFGNRSHLAPQFEHLAACRRVLAFDLPGHGESEMPPPGFGFDDCAAAVVASLDAAGVERAVVCGHSFGGRLAAEVAAISPARIVAAALLDPAILFPAPVREQSLKLVPALETEVWLSALEAYFLRLLSPFDPPDLRSKVQAELADIPRELAPSVMRAGMTTDGAEALARVQCPLLVVRHPGNPMDMDRLRQLHPGAWVGCVVGSGHWLTLSVPGQVNGMLDRFLEVSAAAAT